MNDKKKLLLWIGVVVVAGVALFFVCRPLLSGGGADGDDELTGRRETPTPRPAPGQQIGGAVPGDTDQTAPGDE